MGKEAAKRGVKAFIELSTGLVYKPDSQPSKEGDKLKPWSKIAIFKLQAEEQLAKIEGYVQFLEVDLSIFGAISAIGISPDVGQGPLAIPSQCGLPEANIAFADSTS